MSDDMQPFRIEIPQADVEYLRDRLANARWPGELPGVEWARGVPLGYLKELTGYWRTQYDWRAQELITHGFPSSVAEFLHLIEPLVNPAAGQAFHVVAPSLPGYAFSTPLAGAGWTMGRTARAWAELMRRLGYERYGLHGSDPVDKLILDRMDAFTKEGSGHLAIKNSRPQTIGYGLADSPILQLAWIAEKVHERTDLPVDRDQLLTTVSLYWFTGSGATAAHTLYEQAHSSDWGAHWTEFPRGKHFPAMEAPVQLAADLQAFFGPLQ